MESVMNHAWQNVAEVELIYKSKVKVYRPPINWTVFQS
jgi:hypothetical protein